MRRFTLAAGAATLALLGTTLVAAPPATSSDGFDRSVSAKKSDRTEFAYRAVTYGSRARGGSLPVASGTTSFEAIGCTNSVGVDKGNQVASVEIPGLGIAKGVAARAWTERRGGVHSSYSTHEIAKIVLAESSLGELAISGLKSYSRAYHDSTGFHADTKTEVASITFTPTNGAPQVLGIPTPGQPIVIPGLLEIRIGNEVRKADAGRAKAKADVLQVTLVPTDTRVRVAHTAAQIGSGVKRGVFSGFSAATEIRALNDLVLSGKQPLTRMPCQGTRGQVRGKDVVATPLLPLLDVGVATTRQMGQQRPNRAWGFEQSTVASVDLGAGALVITGIQGRVNVERMKGEPGVTFDSNGTKFLTATVNGTEYSFPALDGISIPGLVEIQTGVVEQVPNGLDVVAVRLTLLDGSGAVVDLGHARLQIAGSGLK